MLEIERTTGRPRQIGLTPLIDVVFLLIIFFMLSTSFIRTESMELSFPSTDEVAKAADDIIRIYIPNDNQIFLGEMEITEDALLQHLRTVLTENAAKPVVLLSGEAVSVQRLVTMMDDVYLLGGQSVSVMQWEPEHGGPQLVRESAAMPEKAS